MSNNNNNTNDNPTKNVKDTISNVSNNIPSLKSIIKSSVHKTNTLLSTLETKKYQVDQNIDSFASSRLRPLVSQMKHIVNRSIGYYERREYYGPQIIAGSVAIVGGLVTLRRGKVPGLFTSAVTGGGAYTGIYGLPQLN